MIPFIYFLSSSKQWYTPLSAFTFPSVILPISIADGEKILAKVLFFETRRFQIAISFFRIAISLFICFIISLLWTIMLSSFFFALVICRDAEQQQRACALCVRVLIVCFSPHPLPSRLSVIVLLFIGHRVGDASHHWSCLVNFGGWWFGGGLVVVVGGQCRAVQQERALFDADGTRQLISDLERYLDAAIDAYAPNVHTHTPLRKREML